MVGFLLRSIPYGTRAPGALAFGSAMAWVPPAILLVAVLFVVRSYRLQGGTLRVRRLLWTTVIPLPGPLEALHDAQAMRGSMRVFGNGGLFSISGWFRSAALGSYRAFVTDPARAVVLRTPSRVIVISPALPHAFLAHL